MRRKDVPRSHMAPPIVSVLAMMSLVFGLALTIGCAVPNNVQGLIAPTGADNQYVLSELGIKLEVPSFVWKARKDKEGRFVLWNEMNGASIVVMSDHSLYSPVVRLNTYHAVVVRRSLAAEDTSNFAGNRVVSVSEVLWSHDDPTGFARFSYVVKNHVSVIVVYAIIWHPSGDGRHVTLLGSAPLEDMSELVGTVNYVASSLK